MDYTNVELAADKIKLLAEDGENSPKSIIFDETVIDTDCCSIVSDFEQVVDDVMILIASAKLALSDINIQAMKDIEAAVDSTTEHKF